jgi:centromeric protein E
MVINSLGQKNGQFVSYRNSKLTRILEPSLTGGSRIMVICNINPTSNNLSQSVNTLKFGVSAGRVKLSIRSANDCSPNISTINDKADLSEDHELLNEELHRMSSKVEDLSS